MTPFCLRVGPRSSCLFGLSQSKNLKMIPNTANDLESVLINRFITYVVLCLKKKEQLWSHLGAGNESMIPILDGCLAGLGWLLLDASSEPTHQRQRVVHDCTKTIPRVQSII